ncbi:glycoside hydrolase superfamily [Collybia nuda]|uniref:Beta-mannosidase B n=1 Tax=Collybia nuda TaxID=64659 RepID=A0A9P6CMJ9_9AGAR|nr:glycoside hydrolase superfamily [Collybia nuda]
MSETHTVQLNQDWFWKQRDITIPSVLDELELPADPNIQDGWTPTHTFPSEVHVELLKKKHIPDPFVGFNEHKVQWIGDTEWLYKCSFPFDRSQQHLYGLLKFEGLDTVCDVYLNGTHILSTDNMFRTYTFRLLLTGDESLLSETNNLLLHFKSAKILAKVEEAKYGVVRAGSTNLGDPSRVYVRKAQYDWRWDWGPELMTCGPYRPITLTTYTARIAEINTRASVSFNKETGAFLPLLKLDVTFDGSPPPGLIQGLSVTLKDTQGNEIRNQQIPLNDDFGRVLKDLIVWKLGGYDVKLWWPVGYGEQNLYDIDVVLVGQNGERIDSQAKRIGFRTVELIQEPLSEPDQYGTGSTFLFEINGVRMFAGGSNWIPADNFLTTITDDRYRAWLTLLRDGNQNMVRVWGGGVYEPDVFYDICDELGILVWQDFQFACGVYPAHREFVSDVRKEAEDNVKRLRHHASIALFCGNNEDYQMVLQWGGINELPARKLYEEVLPDVVAGLTDPPIPYHRGSPYGGEGWDTSDPTIGDVHQWNVWGGKELPYQEYDKLGGRFVSEFGMPSMPDMRTITYWMDGADKAEWYAQSTLMAQHTRAGSFERRFAIAMNENFRITSDLETHVFNTQVMQSEAVGYAYQVWRRNWGGPGKEYTSGVLVWQLNDCWPVTSWALVDYFLRPKPSFFTIARQLAPVTINISRTVVKNRANDRPRQHYEFGAIQSHDATLDIWALNGTLSSLSATLELRFHDLTSNWTHKQFHNVILLPNRASELLSTIRCPGPPQDNFAPPSGDPIWTSTYSVVASARLVDPKGKVLARFADWPQPYRYLAIPDPRLAVKVDGEMITVSVERPVKALFFGVDGAGEEVKWSDNALDVTPGDPQTITVKGLGKRRLTVAYLGKERASKI